MSIEGGFKGYEEVAYTPGPEAKHAGAFNDGNAVQRGAGIEAEQASEHGADDVRQHPGAELQENMEHARHFHAAGDTTSGITDVSTHRAVEASLGEALLREFP